MELITNAVNWLNGTVWGPAMLVLIRPRGFPDAGAGGRSGQSLLARIGIVVLRRRRAVIAGAAILISLAPLGISRIRVQDSWIAGFARDSALSICASSRS